MTISGLGSSYNIKSLTGTQSTSSIASLLATEDTDSASSTSSAADLSKPGQMLAKLKQLQQEDPAKFKEVVSKIADKLSAAAEKAGADTKDGKFLTKLASDFQKAADTGDLSSLEPPARPANDAIAAYKSLSGSDGSALGKAANGKGPRGAGGPPPGGPPPASSASDDDDDSDTTTVKSLLDQIDDELTAALSGSSES
ncbi:MAG TPA: hypothetical protein VGM37_04090 [Armatimonadota bacterium]|jgi:hypothetical protein